MKTRFLGYLKKIFSPKGGSLALVLVLSFRPVEAQLISRIFSPTSDSYVIETSPSTNYGTSTQIRVDGSPLVRSFLKFSVENISGAVTNASLRVFANSNHNIGFTVHRVNDTTWTETGVVYTNAPGFDATSSGASGPLTAGNWYTVDITSLVSGNGTYSIALVTSSTTAMSLTSRESVSPPQLIVEEETSGATPTPTPTATPFLTPTPTPGGSDPVIFAVGDMVPGVVTSCGSSNCKQLEVSQLIADASPAAFLALGDTQYEEGALSDFQTFYQPSYGRVKGITYPAVGNHEYLTPNAQGYFDYFNGVGNQTGQAGDRSKGYYAFNVGQWRLYALNTNCSKAGGCGAGSPQEIWLKEDLAANPQSCSLMFYHHPYVSSDSRGFSYYIDQRALWNDFYAAGGDVVLVGHSHFYERYAPMNPDRIQDNAYGIRQFIVGTGGKNIYDIGTQQPLSEVWNGNTFGALKMTLRADGYDWQFVPIVGQTFTDSGTASCHGAPSPTPTPTPTPTPPVSGVLTFSPIADSHVRLDKPTTNYGSSIGLEVDGSPIKKILLKFNVSGIGSSAIANSKLRLYNVDSSNFGGSFRGISDTSWNESTITWNTAPVFNPLIVATLSGVSRNVWYEVDVSPLITGDGIISIGIDSNATNGADYSSKEGTFAPQLVISLQ